MLNIEFDQEFKNYNFIIEQILNSNAFAVHLNKRLHATVVPTIWTLKRLQIKK
jgi:hypothetical protein